MNRINSFVTNPYLTQASMNGEGLQLAMNPPEEASTWEVFTAPFSIMKDLTKLGKATLFNDKEGQVDLIGKIARAADMTLGITQGIIQGGVLANHLVAKHFHTDLNLSTLSTVAKIITFPFLIFFFALSTVHAIIESVSTARTIRFMDALPDGERKTGDGVLDQLLFIKERFFSLDDKETAELKAFIESKLEMAPLEQKAALFEKIAIQSLQVKKEELVRRVSRWAAEETMKTFPEILKKLDEGKETEALTQARELLSTLKVQAEKKLITHIISLVSVAAALLSLGLCIFGFAPASIVLFFVIFGLSLGATNYLLRNGLVSQKGWNFSLEECIPKFIRDFFTPPAKAPSNPPGSPSKA